MEGNNHLLLFLQKIFSKKSPNQIIELRLRDHTTKKVKKEHFRDIYSFINFFNSYKNIYTNFDWWYIPNYINENCKSFAEDKDVDSSCVLYTDIDFEEDKVIDYKEICKKLPLKPSIIVFSGRRGYHFYWLLKEKANIKDWSIVQEGWMLYLKQKIPEVDEKCKNPSRAMRLPSTKHPISNSICDIIEINDIEYNLSDFNSYLIKKPKAEVLPKKEVISHISTRIAKIISPFWREGNRNKFAMSLSGFLKKKGLDENTVLEIIKEICKEAKDDEMENRLYAVKRTYLQKDAEILGGSGIREILLEENISEKEIDKFFYELNKVISPERTKEEIITMGLIEKWFEREKTMKKILTEKQEVILVPSYKLTNWSYKAIAKTILRENIMITLSDNNQTYIYRDGVFNNLFESSLEKIICDYLGDFSRTHIVSEVKAQIKILSLVDRREVNKYTETMLNLENGMYDVIQGKLLPHSPEYLSTIRIPLVYNPRCKPKKFEDFLYDVCSSEEDVSAIYEMFGYSLFYHNSLQKSFMFVGDGGNGKTTLLNILKSFIGKENTCSLSLQDICNSNFKVAELNDKLLNIYADIPSRGLNTTSMFKSLTGGDSVLAEKKYKNPFDLKWNGKFVFSCNKIPKTDDWTSAFFRRWVIWEFNKKIKDPIPMFEKTIIDDNEEMSGILNKALESYITLMDKKKFANQKNVEKVAEMYLRSSNPVYGFVSDRLIKDPNGSIPVGVLWAEYVQWSNDNGIPVVSKQELTKDIQRLIGGYKIHTRNGDCWRNISLREKEENEIEKKGNLEDYKEDKVSINEVVNALFKGKEKENPKEFKENGYPVDDFLRDLDEQIQMLTQVGRLEIRGSAEEILESMEREGIIFRPRAGFLMLV